MSNQRNNIFPIVISVLALIIAIGALMSSRFSQPKIAYVDANVLLDNYEGMKTAKAVYQEKAQQWQANMDTLTKEFQQAVEAFEGGKASMTQKEQELSKQLISSKRDQLRDYQKAIQQQSQQEDLQITQRVLSEVNGMIQDYAEEKGYDLILGATGSGNIVYGDQPMDITQELVEVLNAKFSGN